MMEKFKRYSKSIAGFWAALAVFAGSVLALGIPFPNGIVATLSVLAASGAVAAVVAGAPANKMTAEQIVKQAPALGIAVAESVGHATVDAVGGAVQAFILREAQGLAQPSKGTVVNAAQQVPALVQNVTEDVVGRILRDFSDHVGRVVK